MKYELKLNLGCGLDKRKGWVNLDAYASVKPDLIHDLLNPLPFSNNSVQYVLAQDILEHFTKEDVRKVIAEIGRVLKLGGKVEVRVPNIDDIIVRFADYKEVRNEFLYGTTEVTGVFGAHKVGYTPEMMTLFMLEQGMTLESLETEQTNYHFIFVKTDHKPELKSLVYVYRRESTEAAALRKRVLSNLEKSNTKVKSVPSPFTSPGSMLQFLVQFLGQEKPQLLLLSGFVEQVIGTWLARIYAVPVIWLEEEQPARLFGRWLKLPKALYYSVKEQPVTVIVPSPVRKNQLITSAHVSLSKIVALSGSAKKDVEVMLQQILQTVYKVEAKRVVTKYLAAKGTALSQLSRP